MTLLVAIAGTLGAVTALLKRREPAPALAPAKASGNPRRNA